MDRLAEYRGLVGQIIQQYAAFPPSIGEIEIETVFDDEHGHYELLYVGWQGWRRVHGVVLHVDVRDDKIWIQHDGTEGGIANDLVAAGVPRQHIVLAFQHPSRRAHTDFAPA
jgi:XisI protein